ncbi:MAG: inorganic phosphate transporter [Bryobacterales bacterium]|nr:inorganic phosphate transporter [Bryobacterales bacterium]
MDVLVLAVVIITVALIFDYINGFHDAANSVATIVATRVLTPFQAVVWAAFFNFVSAFTFGTGVASTVGKGFVNLDHVTPYVILAGLLGAIVWDLITWWWGLPTSSSHALIGGYAGAAIAHAGFHGLILGQWPRTVAFIVIAPMIGLGLAYVLMISIYWLFRGSSPTRMDYYFRKLQLLSAAAYSFAHGTNDAQKTMGIITGVLFTSGLIDTFIVPVWVILAAHAAIALGTLTGGWRIVRTMGMKLTRLKPRGGFSAETAAATSILFATYLHLPVSTTHVIAGSIAGVGSIQRPKAVRWGLATTIVWAWVFTIPASAFIAWVSFFLIRAIVPAAGSTGL